MSSAIETTTGSGKGAEPLAQTGTVAAPGPADAIGQAAAEGAAFAPLDEPPRVDGAELIGEPVDAESGSHPDAPSEAFVVPADREAVPDLESRAAVPIPLERQPGFSLPQDVMHRADDIGRETAIISARVAQIEQANEAAEAAGSVQPTGDDKES